MMKSIQQLKETLQQELKMYKDVLDMAKEKTDILKKAELKKLEEITQKEQQYIRTMGTFEKIRRSIFVNISEEMGISQLSSVSELLLYLEAQEVEEIDTIRNDLLDTIGKLAEVNQFNEKIIQHNLEYVNFNIELMTSSQEFGNNYGEKDLGTGKSIASLLDVKV